MSLTMEAPIDRLSFVALANSSSMEEDGTSVFLIGVDGGARSIGEEERLLAMILLLLTTPRADEVNYEYIRESSNYSLDVPTDYRAGERIKE